MATKFKHWFTLRGCLFGSVKLTKNTDPDKYSYSGYGIGFDTQIEYSLPDGSVGKNVIFFRADMSSSVHIDNKGKDILILGKGITQGLNHKWAAEALYSINFTRPGIKSFLSLYYHGSDNTSNYVWWNYRKKEILIKKAACKTQYQFKAKESEIKKNLLCLGNISVDFSANNIKKIMIEWVGVLFFCWL